MVRYYCTNCNFKYSPKIPRSSPPDRCHNCGGNGTVKFEPTAEDILNSSNYQ